MISYKDILKSWNQFFFEPQSTEGIAVFRIVWVALIGSWYLLSLYSANDFYGPHSILSLAVVKEEFVPFHMNVFHLFQNGYEPLYFLLALYGVALFTSLIGLYTRTSLVIVLVCMTSFHQRNIWILNSSEMLMRLITILLVCSPCGHSLSIDSLLGRTYKSFRKPRNWAPWALRLIQIQISVVYLWTAWHKLKGSDWMDGTALYYATRLEEFYNFPVPFFLDSLLFIKLMTWATLVIELALGSLIWVKEFRKPVIFAGILFHLGIEYVMCIPFFEWTMIALIINFFTPEEYSVFVYKIRMYLTKAIAESTIQSTAKEKMLWAVKGNDE